MKFVHATMVMAVLMLAVGLSVLLPAANPAHAAEGVAAVVNDEPILTSEVYDRVRLLMVSSGLPDTPENTQRMTDQVIDMLVDETLRLQEARKYELTATEEEVDTGFASIAQQNNMSGEEFAAVMRRTGVNPDTLRDQIRTQIVWSKVVQRQLSNQVQVSEYDVDAALERLQGNIGKTEYLVAEIFLPLDAQSDEGDVRRLANELSQQLRAGRAPFSAIAAQFSQSAASSRGGDLGWVQEGQLAVELDEALAQMDKGTLSEPIRSLTGYHLLLLRDTRVMQADTLPTRDELFNRLGLQQLDRLQRRHFLNLKAAAFIERRGV